MDETAAVEVKYSSRGFKHFDPVEDTYGGNVRVYESSSACEPHIWLAVEQAPEITPELGVAHSHLTLEQAKQVIAQLQYLIEHHYQLDSSESA